MMSVNNDFLRKALQRPPWMAPKKPTSVPPMTLEAVLRRAQDRLRVEPKERSWWRRLLRRLLRR
jgi:hypothetical protein